jgi:hypothetical protein
VTSPRRQHRAPSVSPVSAESPSASDARVRWLCPAGGVRRAICQRHSPGRPIPGDLGVPVIQDSARQRASFSPGAH